MDGTRLKRIKEKLEIADLKEMDQKQFNDLVTNLSYLDQETVRHVVRNVPDLSEKVLNYFNQLNDSAKVDTKDYLESMKSHHQMLSELLREDSLDNSLKNKIGDELLEHSKWLRKEATLTRVFKMAVSAIGLGLAFVFIKGMGNNTKYRHENARISPENNMNRDSNDGYINDGYINRDNSTGLDVNNNDDYSYQHQNDWDDYSWNNDNNYSETIGQKKEKVHIGEKTHHRMPIIKEKRTGVEGSLQTNLAKDDVKISALNKNTKMELTI